MSLPDVKERFATIGFEPVGGTPERFAAHLKAESAEWARVVRDAKIRDRLNAHGKPNPRHDSAMVDSKRSAPRRRGALPSATGKSAKTAPADAADAGAHPRSRLRLLAVQGATQRGRTRCVHVLAEGPLDIQTLVARSGCTDAAPATFSTRSWRSAYCGATRMAATPTGRTPTLYLDRRKPTYLGGLLEHLNARHYQNWGLLTQALRTGMPQSGALGDRQLSGALCGRDEPGVFLNGMTAGSLIAARALAAKFPWRTYTAFIDIGTAEGCVPVEIARAPSTPYGRRLRSAGCRA